MTTGKESRADNIKRGTPYLISVRRKRTSTPIRCNRFCLNAPYYSCKALIRCFI